jgi:geranylgeranyl pyrophosphate synthase
MTFVKSKDPLVRLLREVSVATAAWLRENVVNSDCSELSPLISHALTATVPGHDRALMVRLGCELNGIDWHEALPGMASWELFNIGLLVTDDFFDVRTTKRMGKKTIHQQWGAEASMVVGFVLNALSNDVLVNAWRKSSMWSLKDALRVLQWATKCEYYSQYLENTFLTKPLQHISLDMYLNLIRNSTSVGVAGAFELGCVMGGGTTHQQAHCRTFGLYLGDLIQIRDDLVDYIYNESLINKGPFNDLFAKKRRLPLLSAFWLATPTEKARIEQILSQPFITLQDALVITELITTEKVKEHIRAIASSKAKLALREIGHLRGSNGVRRTLRQLVEMAIDL